ncbi:hypothetical protein Ct61P_14583 [Colletotrichum tofieldiae]|nr:hypothetical protein Ct61P_14583 [Colletotrichum tofieldiae]
MPQDPSMSPRRANGSLTSASALPVSSAQAYVLRQAHADLVMLSRGGGDGGIGIGEISGLTEVARAIHKGFSITKSGYNVYHERWGNDMRDSSSASPTSALRSTCNTTRGKPRSPPTSISEGWE